MFQDMHLLLSVFGMTKLKQANISIVCLIIMTDMSSIVVVFTLYCGRLSSMIRTHLIHTTCTCERTNWFFFYLATLAVMPQDPSLHGSVKRNRGVASPSLRYGTSNMPQAIFERSKHDLPSHWLP